MSGNAGQGAPEHPDVNVKRRLSDAYGRVRATGTSPGVPAEQLRLVVFSDHHRGIRDGADDFERCEEAYNAALGYYLEQGYTLVVLGDVEDLWECRPKPVLEAYARTTLLEADFQKEGRYVRVSGNHDDLWENADAVRSHLAPLYGEKLSVREGLLLSVDLAEGRKGEVFLTHGHQGDQTSDRRSALYGVSKLVVRYGWRPLQRLTGWKLTTPAKSFELRESHNLSMYAWACGMRGAGRPPLVLIAGHTHVPVFASTDHVGLLRIQVEQLRASLLLASTDAARRAALDALAKKRALLESVRCRNSSDVASLGLQLPVPCYFNTGCCSYRDGDITGIELAEGQIRLVRWPDDDGDPARKILDARDLRGIF